MPSATNNGDTPNARADGLVETPFAHTPVTSSTELAPCPFCGDPMKSGLQLTSHVELGDCIIGSLAFPNEVITAWNARHPSTELGDEVERVARKTVDFILSRWEIDNPPLASQLAKYTSQEILAALRQSTRSVDDGWRDISTAPKDQWILAWDADGGHALLKYNPIFAMAGEDADGWMGSTHWRPLPHPPSTEICDA